MKNDENQFPTGNPVKKPVTNPYKMNKPQHFSNVANQPLPLSEKVGSSSPQKLHVLMALQRDYEALQKESINACLRSKAFPCPEVSNLLDNNPNIGFSVLQQDFQVLLEHPDYLGQTMDDNTIPKKSSLWFMTRVGTAIRFLQLLVFAKGVDIQESTKMIAVLLKKVSTRVEDILKDNNSEIMSHQESTQDASDDDAEQDLLNMPIKASHHPLQISCFAFAFLTRIKTPLLQERPQVLAPFWRSVNDIAVAMSRHCPIHLLQSSVGSLFQGIKGILQDYLNILGQSGSSSQVLPPKYFKMASFSFARLESFLQVSSVARGELDEALVGDLLCLLLCFRGLPAIASHQLQTNSASSDQLHKLASKADKCLLPIVLSDSNTALHLANLKQVFDLADTCESLSLGGLEDVNDPTGLIHPAISIGKVQVLVQVLNTSLITPVVSNRDGLSGLLTDQLNATFQLCEHMLFVALPLCFGLVIYPCLKNRGETNPQVDLDEALRTISDTIYLIETCAPSMTYNASRGVMALHRMLLRWLMPMPPAASKTDSTPRHHPLARECAISIVDFHCIRLYGEHSTSENMPLVKLLVKALFDQRTCLPLRQAIATVLRDLLSSGSQNFITAVQAIICAEYASSESQIMRKRKRGKPNSGGNQEKTWRCSYTFEDLQVIGSILARLPISDIPNATADIESFFLQVVATDGDSKKHRKKLKRHDVNCSILMLALLEAAVRGNFDVASVFQRLASRTGQSSWQQQICNWFLFRWNTEFEAGKRAVVDEKRMNRLAVLGTAVLGLLGICRNIKSSNVEDLGQAADRDLLKVVCKVIDLCSSDSLLKGICERQRTFQGPLSNQSGLEQLFLVAARFLHISGKTWESSAIEANLDSLIGFLARLWGGNCCWSLGATLIESILVFMSSVEPTKQSKLVASVPDHLRMGLLGLGNCRQKGKVYKYHKHEDAGPKNKRMKSEALVDHCARKLGSLICPHPLSLQAASTLDGKSSDFPTNPVPIEIGSYVLKMTTQEGRHALVVFPPGEASLSDIKLMMGDDDNGSDVRRLRRVSVARDGSCLAYL